jgi:hypothetical protein
LLLILHVTWWGNRGMSRGKVVEILATTVLPIVMDHLFNEDGPWDGMQHRIWTWRTRRTTFEDVMAVRHTCGSWMRYVGCTPHFAAMHVARLDTESQSPPYWILQRDYLQHRFRSSYSTFRTIEGWQGPSLFSIILAVGPFADWELAALRLVLQSWSSVTPSLRTQLLNADDSDVRAAVLQLAIRSLP